MFQTAGRIMSLKSHGKLAFAKIRDHSGTFQICFMRDIVKFNTGKALPQPLSKKGEKVPEVVESITISGEEKSAYKIAEKFIQVGDYIGVK